MRWVIAAILFSPFLVGCVAVHRAKALPLPAATQSASCESIFKPGKQSAMMVLMFDFYQQHENKPYLVNIIENWMTTNPVGYCESAWQYGDLNSDGVVDYADFSIYAGNR